MHCCKLTLGVAFMLAAVGVGSAQQPVPIKKGPDPKASMPKAQAPAPTPAPTTQAPFDKTVARRITGDEIKKRMDAGEKFTVVDTRSKFTGPKAKDAHLINLEKVEGWAKDLAKDTLIVAYCT